MTLKTWNDMTFNERLASILGIRKHHNELVEYTKSLNTVNQRLRDYYLGALDRLADDETYPICEEVDASKLRRLPKYNTESKCLRGSDMSILTLVATCYPKKRAEKKTKEWDISLS